jgi:tether containing UBX domain for GLUT4
VDASYLTRMTTLTGTFLHRNRHNRKQLDLSLSFRLSGLSSGAKLELVQASRSPSVVTVGLQLPESEARGAPNGRILDKFPSTTTLWLVLRKFEAGVAGSGLTRNFTSRAVPVTDDGESSGSLYYEAPVLQILERKLSSFTDLQKSLAQLGFNSGNVLIRLSFRRTEQRIEEAMLEIGEFFKSEEDDTPAQDKSGAPTVDPTEVKTEEPVQQLSAATQPEPSSVAASEPVAPPPTTLEPATSTTESGRTITVFSPPSEDTPSSAQIAYNENDYIPSIEHAQLHQRLLNESSRNQRLPTHAEMAAKAKEEEAKQAAIREVDVKVRFPDQSQVVAKFGTSDTGQSLYEFVRSCLAPPFANEDFSLTVHTASRSQHTSAIPSSEKRRLIKDIGLTGRVLVNFSWAENAASFVHERRTETLRPELRSQAQQLKVEQPPEPKEQETVPQPGPSSAQGDAKPSGARKSGAVPKWLKLGKK